MSSGQRNLVEGKYPGQTMIPRQTENRKLTVGFQVTTREVGGIIVVDAVGRLTLSDSRTQLRDLIHVFCGNGHKKFLLNLAGVDFMDSDGMGELVRCYSIVRQGSGEMKLVQVNQKVQELLQVTRLNTLFEIYGEERVALQAFMSLQK